MKKLNLIFSMLLISCVLNAQNDWNESGNTGTTPGTDYLGTTDNASLVFKTWGTEQMRLLPTGELGLGTSTPANWLHIVTNASGTVNAKETFRTDVPTTTESNWRMYRGTSNMFRLWHGTFGNDIFIQALRGGLKFSSGNTGSTVSAMEIVGGTSSTADGNVIIGDYATYTPSARLHVKGNGYSSLMKVESSALTTPTFQIDETEKHTFKCRPYTGNIGAGAFDFTYAPSSSNSYGIGIRSALDGTNSITNGWGIYSYVSGTIPNAIGIASRVESSTSSLAYGIQSSVNNPSTTGSNSRIYGVHSSAQPSNASTTTQVYGFYSYVPSITDQSAYGARFEVNGASLQNIGLDLGVDGASDIYNKGIHASISGSTSTNYGIDISTTGHNGIGVITSCISNGNGGQYAFSGTVVDNGNTGPFMGIYANAPNQTCASGSGTSGCAGAAGFFVGDLFHSGGIFAGSDAMIKQNVTDVIDAVAILSNLNCKQYEFNTQQYPQFNLALGQHYGFIAQEVEVNLPSLVKEFSMPHPAKIDSIGGHVAFKAVNYEELIPLLVQAIKQQQVQINTLIANPAIHNNYKILDNNINYKNKQRIEISDRNGIILNQNDPNPFTESTRITYQIPDDVREVKIIFTNSTGSIINTVVINERGTGELEVYASDLSKGIYQYTLVCDGKVIATKKMVKQ